MRWQVILTICLSLLVIGLEQSPVVGQLFPGIARACGGCGRCDSCGPQRIPRRFCRRCPGLCVCPPMVPPAPCPPAPCPQMCPTYTTRLHPRRVVNWEMVPQTVCRRQAYCEQIPVTTYRQVVVTVPQTEMRSVMRFQNVAEQVMVPRRSVSTVWEPRVHRSFVPVCPPPMVCPPMPVATDGCTDFGGPSIMPHPTPFDANSVPQPTLTVPSAPSLSSPYENQKVPAPMKDPVFTPTNPDDSQSYYSPWQPVPSRHAHNHSHPHQHYGMAHNDGYRTLNQVPQTAASGPLFVPAPSGSTVWTPQR